VTFTWNPNGDDYRIRIGKTRIGSAVGNDIILPDGKVSGAHCELLYRGGVLKIKDNFSTNGTLINGTDIGDVATILNDGDTILIGATELKLRLI